MTISSFPRGVPSDPGKRNFPDAAWADPGLLASHEKWQLDPGAIFVGGTEGTPLGIHDDRHLMTVAGSRSGKGRSVIIPNLCVYCGSVMAIDPKGDLATVTAARRGQGSEHCEGLGQEVFVLDPFKVAQGNARDYRAGFNPLDAIDPHGEDGRDDAALLADALIIPSQTDTHWTDAARQFLTGLILHICESADEKTRNLIQMRRLLTADQDGFTTLLAEMSLSEAANGVVARAANAIIAMADRERSGVISTCIVQTEFFDSPAMQSVLSKSDFSLRDLKDRPCTVYLSLPAGRMGTHSRWLRLMIALTIEAM